MTRAYASTVIDGPVEQVWRHLRDFGNIDAYYAPTETTDVDGLGDQVGCIRTARHRETGQIFREQLLALSDVEHYASYTQLQFPPVKNCVITVRLRPVTVPPATFIEWYCDFDVVDGDEAQLIDFIVAGVYEPCFEGLKALTARNQDSPQPARGKVNGQGGTS
jgi:hypothetical protein